MLSPGTMAVILIAVFLALFLLAVYAILSFSSAMGEQHDRFMQKARKLLGD